jgi:opacity protein-like surface antigen
MRSKKLTSISAFFVLLLLSFFVVDARAFDVYGFKKVTVGLELGAVSPTLNKGLKDSISDDYRFNFAINAGVRGDYYGIELFYQTSGKSDKKISDKEEYYEGYGKTTIETDAKTKGSLSSLGIDFLGYYPLNNQGTELLAGIGIVNYEFEVKTEGKYSVSNSYSSSSNQEGSINYTQKESATSLRFTLGAQHALSQNIKVGANFKYSPVTIKVGGIKMVEGVTEFNFSTKYEF